MKFKNREHKNEEELNGARNIIGKGTTLQGDLETLGNIRLEGKMIGNITLAFQRLDCLRQGAGLVVGMGRLYQVPY